MNPPTDCASTRGLSATLPKLRFENEGKCEISEMRMKVSS